MAALDNELAEIERLIRLVRVADAEQRLRALFTTMGDEQLRTWEKDLRSVIQQFHPKRRKALAAALDDEFHRPAAASAPARARRMAGEDDVLEDLRRTIRTDLQDLSANHIFQWATYYRDRLGGAFEGLFQLGVTGSAAQVAAMARAEVSAHTTDIFTEGYTHTMTRQRDKTYPMTKSLSGLQRLLDIPIELYSTKLTRGVSVQDARVLSPGRAIRTAPVGAVLSG